MKKPFPDEVDVVAAAYLENEAPYEELEVTPLIAPEFVVPGRYYPEVSSSNSLILENILLRFLWRSSSSINESGIINVLFLLTKLEVPTLPEIAQSMPFHCLLKFDYIYFNRSSALISC